MLTSGIHIGTCYCIFKWLDTARKDLVDGRLLQYNKIEMGNHLKECFGSETGKAVFNSEAETVRSAIAAEP